MRNQLLATCLAMSLGSSACFAHTGSRRSQETTTLVVTGIVLVGVIIAIASNHNEASPRTTPEPTPGGP